MTDWRKPCEHGEYENHLDNDPHLHGRLVGCPGGSPVTVADLEGEKVWWCLWEPAFLNADCTQYGHKGCGWRLLIPIPEASTVEST